MAVPGCTQPDPNACTGSPLPLSAPLLCPALLSLNLLTALKVTPAGYALLILEIRARKQSKLHGMYKRYATPLVPASADQHAKLRQPNGQPCL